MYNIASVNTGKAYPIVIWLVTILMGTLIWMIYVYIDYGGPQTDSFSELIGWYFVGALIGLVWSTPLFLVQFVLFHYLLYKVSSEAKLKIILNMICVTGVFLTFRVVFHEFEYAFSSLYSCVLVLFSFVFRVNVKKIVDSEERD